MANNKLAFPRSDLLGELEIVTVYEYYDKPCLFSCKNEKTQLFVAVWVDDNLAFEQWICAHVSVARLTDLESKIIDLRSIFENTDCGFVVNMKVFHSDKVCESSTIKCSDLRDEVLPEKGVFLR